VTTPPVRDRRPWEFTGRPEPEILDDAQWITLRATDTLPIEYLAEVAVGDDGVASVAVELPMPRIRSLRLAWS
jgi:hypothetical protein